MAVKKAAKKSSKKVAKTVIKVGAFDVNKKVLAATQVELKKGDESNCEVIRKIAKRFSGVRRGELEATLVKGLKMNLGTVRRQIQEGRAA